MKWIHSLVIRNWLHRIGMLPVAVVLVPVLLVVFLLRPFVLIRFGKLVSRRIGHFAGNTALYLSEKKLGIGARSLDIFYYEYPICNRQVKKMIERYVVVCPVAAILDRWNRKFFKRKEHTIVFTDDADVERIFEKTPIAFEFTDEEKEFGRKELQRLGLKDGEMFICFHSRNAAYLKHALASKNYDYHNYRDTTEENFMDAAQYMATQGYSVFRMGAVVQKKLPPGNPKVIDYAGLYRSDFLDIYLCSQCRFFIGTTAGLASVAMAFHRPIVYTNFVGFSKHSYSNRALFIFKKLWLKKERRFLSLPEIRQFGLFDEYTSQVFFDKGVEVIENTKEEILDVVMEMDARLRGQWQETEEDRETQRRFWSAYYDGHVPQMHVAKVGRMFVKKNMFLLG